MASVTQIGILVRAGFHFALLMDAAAFHDRRPRRNSDNEQRLVKTSVRKDGLDNDAVV